MIFVDIFALVIFAIIGPVPMLFHPMLHAALAFWRRHVMTFYVVCSVVWVGWMTGTWFGAPWLAARVFAPPAWLVLPTTLLALAVLSVALWSIATIGWRRFFVYAVLRPDRVPTMTRVTSGPFRFFRHPAYTSYRVAAVLLMVATGSRGAIILTIASLFLFPLIIRLEERELRLRVASATL